MTRTVRPLLLPSSRPGPGAGQRRSVSPSVPGSNSGPGGWKIRANSPGATVVKPPKGRCWCCKSKRAQQFGFADRRITGFEGIVVGHRALSNDGRVCSLQAPAASTACSSECWESECAYGILVFYYKLLVLVYFTKCLIFLAGGFPMQTVQTSQATDFFEILITSTKGYNNYQKGGFALAAFTVTPARRGFDSSIGSRHASS